MTKQKHVRSTEEVMKLALEALESCDFTYTFGNGGYQQFDQPSVEKAIIAIQEALAEQASKDKEQAKTDAYIKQLDEALALVNEVDQEQPAQQYPIWFWTHPTYGRLYKQPPAQRTWVGLTDEERTSFVKGGTQFRIVKAIEAKLKEKNT